jgi:hypothetical protein
LETLLQHLAVHYGDGHRQMPYIRFVSCSGYYHFIYSQVPGNARAVLCSLRKSRRIAFFIICSAKDRAYFLFPFVL